MGQVVFLDGVAMFPSVRRKAQGPRGHHAGGEGPLYAKGSIGRPGRLLRLQPVTFFEDPRSVRELMRVAADLLCIHWYLD
jgi:hypothetical protein